MASPRIAVTAAATVVAAVVMGGFAVAQSGPTVAAAVTAAEVAVAPGEVPADRDVTFRLELDGPVRCGAETGDREYGVVLDADRDADTGTRVPGLDPLGIEARVSARCSDGRLVGAAGSAFAREREDGSTLLQIVVPAGELPSSDLSWIAFSREEDVLTRVPDSGAVRWTLLERALP